MSNNYLVFYDDNKQLDLAPELLPERGIQAIIQRDKNVGWYCISSKDFYVWLDPDWAGVDIFGLWDYLCTPGWKRVLFGRTINSDEYERIYQEALNVMGEKSALLPDERMPS